MIAVLALLVVFSDQGRLSSSNDSSSAAVRRPPSPTPTPRPKSELVLPIVFPRHVSLRQFPQLQHLPRLPTDPFYGSLDLSFHHFKRRIHSNDAQKLEEERAEFLDFMKEHDLREKAKYDPFDDLDFPRNCTRPQWTFELHPNCNNIHVLTYNRDIDGHGQDHYIQYLHSGAFRDGWSFEPQNKNMMAFVTKTKRFSRDLDRRDIHKINAEANIMEKLSSSRVTSDIYGHCGTTILVELGREIENKIVPSVTVNHQRVHGRIRQSVLDAVQVDDVYPMNTFSNWEKLDIAVAMAESLAEMHGFKGGVMTNDDIALGQWLYSATDGVGRVILNDFNDAMYMEWSETAQGYCQYYRSFGGTFKAPEEYDGDYLDESVDVWPMGNIIFTLLTGLKPYYDTFDEEDIQEVTKKGPPYIDPRYRSRSYIERRMVEVMDDCHKLVASERISMFEVVRRLRDTRAEASKSSRSRR